ncbi:hypothetical protein [Fodinicola feengrottensis]|uniref:Secreted protein n=1 Tax=Fodinicola feengrottensis TaxID=435914 RepID=A0ABN2J6W4_9ACTN|nr:hypothetical protein [Fodinicola feengrottensis]
MNWKKLAAAAGIAVIMATSATALPTAAEAAAASTPSGKAQPYEWFLYQKGYLAYFACENAGAALQRAGTYRDYQCYWEPGSSTYALYVETWS